MTKATYKRESLVGSHVSGTRVYDGGAKAWRHVIRDATEREIERET